MKGLEGLPVSFVARHSRDISNHMKEILLEDSFIKKYEIDVETNLSAGTDSVLKVDALTDHWIIKTEAWLDTGRDGDKNYAFRGMLGHYMGKHDILSVKYSCILVLWSGMFMVAGSIVLEIFLR